MRLRFSDFVLDFQLGRLESPGGEVHLRPQAFRLLELLVREAPRVLGRDEILNAIWGTEHLSENSLRQAISELRQALGDSASRPTIIETVHRRGYRMIARVEPLPATELGALQLPERARPEAAPEPRPQAPAPEPLSEQNADTAPPSRRSRQFASGRFRIAALLFLALWVRPLPTTELADPGHSARSSIAILELEGFDADGSEFSWLASAVREMLRFELGVAGAAKLIHDEEVEWALRRIGIDDRSDLAPEQVRSLGRRLGARWVIHGSFLASLPSRGLQESQSQDIQIQLQISDALTGGGLGWARERGEGGDVLEIVRRLVHSVRAQIPTGPPVARHVDGQSWLASSGDSLKLFAQGAEALARRDATKARGLLEQAAMIDTDNPLNHSMLASAYQNLGLSALAAASAERSAQLGGDLPWEHRESVAARADRISGRCEEARKRLVLLHQRFPDDLDYGLRLSQSHECSGHLEKALDIVHSLRARLLYGTADLRLDMREIHLLVALNRLDDAKSLAAHAVEAALQRDAPMLAADGLVLEFWIHFRQGQYPGADTALERLESVLAADNGWRSAVANACLAVLRHRQGDVDAARAAHEQALAIYRRIGHRKGEASALNNYASLLNSQGDGDGMVAALSRSIELKREIGEPSGLVISLSNLANIHVMRGEIAAADPLLVEAVDLARDIDDPHQLAVCLRSQGRLAGARGELETAELKYRESLELSEDAEDLGGAAWSLRSLGNLLRSRGETGPAAEHLHRATAAFERVGDLPDLAATHCLLADLELAEDRLESAAAFYARVLELTEGRDLLIYQAEARQGLGKIAQAEGQLETARRELRTALDLWHEAGREDEVLEVRASLNRLDSPSAAGS